MSKDDINSAASKNTDYNQQAQAVKDTLNTLMQTKLTVRGKLSATGISMIPVTATAFVKIAQVKMADGSTMNVVSSSGNDVTAADGDGVPLPTDDVTINVLPTKPEALILTKDLSTLSLPHVTMLSPPPFPAGPLPEELLADDGPSGDMSQGLVISNGGFVIEPSLYFDLPPFSHGESRFSIQVTGISVDDMDIMDKFMQNALSASKYKSYKTHAKASASGSWCLFGGPSYEASAKVTHDAMSG